MQADINGISMHWEEAGAGEPLLFLHGGMGCGEDWRFIFPEPPAGYRMVGPDLRGHGGTALPVERFTFADCARDVAALLDRLGLARVKAIGVSGGAIVLLHMATAIPSSIESMVVVSPARYFPEKARAIMRQLSPEMFGEIEMARMRERHSRREGQFERLFDALRHLADDYDDVNFTTEKLSAIVAKTLIVFGDRDFLYPVSMAVEMYEAIPNAALWVVPNGPHGPVFGEHAPRFAAAALEFLQS